jgi:putative Ca2+/H+ antiporter (TMEM165/GDT1 family)
LTVGAAGRHATPVLALFFATYAAVFAAEIVGDKLLYTTGVLATRFRAVPIMLGMALAFMAKMAVAVAIGHAIAQLPRVLVAVITAVSFCGVAWALWRKPVQRDPAQAETALAKAAMLSFAAIFFSEWGDVGQITAATMSARFPASPLTVWAAAVAAMVTKGILAVSVGAGLRGWIQRTFPPQVIRIFGVAVLIILGILSIAETLMGHEG